LPAFVNASANLASWGGTTAGGGTATATAALATIQTNTALVKQASTGLLAYIRSAFKPTNAVLQAASYAGDSSPVDANGGTWPGGAPGIGAMAVYAAAAPKAGGATLLMGI